MFCNICLENSLRFSATQEFWKSVKIRQSCHEKFDAPFLGHSVYRVDDNEWWTETVARQQRRQYSTCRMAWLQHGPPCTTITPPSIAKSRGPLSDCHRCHAVPRFTCRPTSTTSFETLSAHVWTSTVPRPTSTPARGGQCMAATSHTVRVALSSITVASKYKFDTKLMAFADIYRLLHLRCTVILNQLLTVIRVYVILLSIS